MQYPQRIYYLLFCLFAITGTINSLSAKPTKRKLKYDVVICAVFKNEELFLDEWIRYHRNALGVQHFYLFDNLSTDRSRQILEPYIKSGDVHVFSIAIETHNKEDYDKLVQQPVYRKGLEIAKKTAHWVAFIDIDEFIVPKHHNKLIDLLNKYKQYGGLVINWQLFGTSHLDDIPPGKLLIESLVWKAPEHESSHHMIKSIVQPKFVSAITDPHSMHFIPGVVAVNSNGIAAHPGGGAHPEIVIDEVQINHYWFGTRNWFIKKGKMARRVSWGMTIDPNNLKPFFAGCNVVRDESILRFVPKVKGPKQGKTH